MDYLEQCRFALEPSLFKLLSIAEMAGWDRTHVALAVLNLCAEQAELPQCHLGLQ